MRKHPRMGRQVLLRPCVNMTLRSRVAKRPLLRLFFSASNHRLGSAGPQDGAFLKSEIGGHGKAGDVKRQSIFWQLAALMRWIDSSASGISQKDPNGSLFFLDFDFSFPRKPSHSHRNQ